MNVEMGEEQLLELQRQAALGRLLADVAHEDREVHPRPHGAWLPKLPIKKSTRLWASICRGLCGKVPKAS